jgi:hypothetical protein
MHPHHHHGGGWGGWSGIPWSAYTGYYQPQIEYVQPTFEVPTWAWATGLGLLAVIAFGGRR